MKTGLIFKAGSIFRRCAVWQSAALKLIYCLILSFSFFAFGELKLVAQLAITEVMPSAATNCAVQTGKHPDFWELTNYGPEPIDLAGYRVGDADEILSGRILSADSLLIRPRESIVFVRDNTALLDSQAFQEWWWGSVAGSPPGQIIFHQSPGLDQGGETLFLWDAADNLVDRIEYPDVPEFSGLTLAANPAAGGALVPSETNVAGGFRAAACDDVGSPGWAPESVPLSITEAPLDTIADAGSPMTLRVRATGLPRPMVYDWHRNGTFIGRSGLASSEISALINFAGSGLAWEPVKATGDFALANSEHSDAGEYFVVVGNGLQNKTSAVARVIVNTNPTPPRVEAPSGVTWFPTVDGARETNLVVLQSQRAVLSVFARAYPSPTFQWSHSTDGLVFTNIAAGTNQLFTIESVQENDAGIYRVEVANSYGKTYAYARLRLAPPPQLRITEAMPLPCEPSRHDWWELTNIGTEAANIAGYRWDDEPGVIGGGPTITNAVMIQPGESIIFLESQTLDSFREWWGEQNLPENLKCIVYKANGLTETGDELNLWNHSAFFPDDKVHLVSFSLARRGVTYWFDVTCKGFYTGVLSTNALCGSFSARNGCDVGSPGWTRWSPPQFSNIQHTLSGARLEWKAQAGSANIVQYASSPTGGETGWKPLGTFTFSTVSGTTTDTTLGPGQQRFYRILRVTEAECPCPEDL